MRPPANRRRIAPFAGQFRKLVIESLENRRLLVAGPTITDTQPSLESGAVLVGTSSIQFNFSETVRGDDTASNYFLEAAGADGKFGTKDDSLVPLTAKLHTPTGLGPGDTYHIIFATSFAVGLTTDTTVPPILPAIGGPLAADWAVNSAAFDAGLLPQWNAQDLVWKALLSTATTNTRDYLNISGPVYNRGGQRIADDSADLWDGNLDAPVSFDASGAPLPDGWRVWTGTNAAGTLASERCGNWANPAATSGRVGDIGRTNAGWVAAALRECNSVAGLYGVSPLLTVSNQKDTLAFPALSIGKYRLTATDNIYSTAGRALDGNGDGTEHGFWVREFNVVENPWHNKTRPLDVNDDTHIVADDVVAIINRINASGSGPVPLTAQQGIPAYYDADNDAEVSASDVISIINHINARGHNSEAEASSSQYATSANMLSLNDAPPLNDALLELLALDLSASPRRRGK